MLLTCYHYNLFTIQSWFPSYVLQCSSLGFEWNFVLAMKTDAKLTELIPQMLARRLFVDCQCQCQGCRSRQHWQKNGSTQNCSCVLTVSSSGHPLSTMVSENNRVVTGCLWCLDSQLAIGCLIWVGYHRVPVMYKLPQDVCNDSVITGCKSQMGCHRVSLKCNV